MRLSRIIFSPVACLGVPYFATLSQKRHDFMKSVEHKLYVLIFYSKLLATFRTQTRIQRDVAISVHRHSGIKWLLFLSYCNGN